MRHAEPGRASARVTPPPPPPPPPEMRGMSGVRAAPRLPSVPSCESPRRGLAAALLALPLLVGLACGAQAQTDTLVSNIGNSLSGAASDFRIGQSFTTGGNSSGYLLSSVDIKLDEDPGDGTVVVIRRDNSGAPGAIVATLATPSSLSGNATFNAPANTMLAANTMYWLVVNDSGNDYLVFALTDNGAETGLSGWSIGQSRFYDEDDSSWREGADGDLVLMALKGSAITAPTLTITGLPAKINNNNALQVLFTFSQTVTGFVTDDVTVTGGRKGAFGGSGSIYTMVVTPTSGSDVVVTVAADSATDGTNTGPPNAESKTAVWDASAPTVDISGVPARISNRNAFTATFTFSEAVTGFAASDVSVTKATKGAFTATSDTVYTLVVTPNADADVTVTVGANSATDGLNTGPTSAETATAVWGGAPPAPTGLAATAGDGQVALSWTNPSISAITKYQYRSGTGASNNITWENWTDIASSGADTTSHTVASLTNGTEYSFQIRAFAGTTTGTASVVSSDTIATPLAANAPAKPSGFTATAGNAQVVLAWTDPTNNAITKYQVRQGTGSTTIAWGAWTDIAGSGRATTTHTVTGLTNDTAYSFQVRAVATAVLGAASDTKASTPLPPLPAKPSGFRATPGDAEATLDWTDPIDSSITGYQFQQRVSGNAWPAIWSSISASDADTTSHTVASLTNGTEYEYRIRAVNSRGQGPASDAVSATPVDANAPSAPASFTATAGLGQVALAWADPINNAITKYQVRRGTGSPVTWGAWTDIASSGAATTSHTVTGLTGGTAYSFQVRAVATALLGAMSDTATATPFVATVEFTDFLLAINENEGPLTVTLQLSQAVAAVVEVYLTSTDRTAITGADYAAGTVTAPDGTTGTYKATIAANATEGSTTIAIINDSIPEINKLFALSIHQIVSTAAIGRGDTDAVDIAIRDLDTNIALPDPATLTVTEASGSTRTATYDVALKTRPSSNVTVAVASQDTDVANVNTASLTFTPEDWNTAQTVTVTAVDDDIDQSADRTVVIRHISSSEVDRFFVGRDPADLTVTVTDDDTAGLTFDPAELTVAEGGSGTYTVVLDSEPTANVTVTVAGASGEVTVDTDGDNAGDQSTLTFTAQDWDTAQTVTVSAGSDDDSTDDSATLTHTASGGGYGSVTGDVAVTVNEPAGAPTGLTATAGPQRVVLSWDNPSDNSINFYQLQQRVAGTAWPSTSVDLPRFFFTTTRTGLTNGTEYDFRLRSVSGIGIENYGPWATVSATPLAADAPAAPDNFTAMAGDTEAVLAWSDPSDIAITKYQVRQGTGSTTIAWGAWADIASSGASTTGHTVTGLTNGTAYSFQVRAVATAVLGAASAAAAATPSVNINAAPAVATALTDQSVVAGRFLSYQFAAGSFTDADSDDLAYSATRGDDSALPAWLTFTAATRTFSGTPSAADAGTLTVKVTASDGNGGAASDEFDIAVSAATVAVQLQPDNNYEEDVVGGKAEVSVLLSPATRQSAAVDVYIASSDGTATKGSDYAGGSETSPGGVANLHKVTIAANAISATLSIDITDDNVFEGPETFTLTIVEVATTAAGVGIGATGATFTATINDNERGIVLAPDAVPGAPVDLTEAAGAGRTHEYTVALASRPTADVVIALTAFPPGAASVEPASLTFTGTNWSRAQTVTVTAEDNAVDEAGGSIAGSIVHVPTSDDSRFLGRVLLMSVADDDPTAVTLAGAAADIAEGATKDFTITLGRGLVNGEALPVPLAFGGGAARNTDYTVACPTPLPDGVTCNNLNTATTPTVTFTGPSTGATARTVTLTLSAAADGTPEAGGETVSVALGTLSGTGLAGGAAGTDDLEDFKIFDATAAPAGLTATPGSGQVRLRWLDPSNDAITKYQVRRGTGDPVDYGNWADIASSGAATTSHTVTGLTNDTAYSFQVRAFTGMVAGAAASAAATPSASLPTVRFTRSSNIVRGEGAAATVTLSLSAAVSDPVDIYLTAGGGTATKGSDYAAGTATAPGGAPGTYKVTIPASQTSGSTTIATTDDSEFEGSGENFLLGIYEIASDSAVVLGSPVQQGVSIPDNDPGVLLSATSLTVTEAAGTTREATYTAKLAAQPTADVTVAVASRAAGVATAGPASLTFTDTDWSTAQTVTVTAVDDDIDQASDRTTAIRHTASSADTRFTAVSLPDLTVTVTDDDTAGLTFDPAELTVAEGGSGTYTVVLDSEPTANVTVSVSGASGEVTADTDGDNAGDQSTLTFTAQDWDTAQTVTVSAGSDDDSTDDSATLTHTASGGGYGSVTGNVAVTVTDDDTAGVTAAQPSDKQVTEGDNSDTATFTVVLDTLPSSAVTVTVTAAAGLELDGPDGATAFGTSEDLTFSTTNWSAAQTVTVRATDNNADNLSGRELKVAWASTSSDSDYNGLSGDAATVTVADDDPTTVTLAGAAGDVAEGGTKTFTITLGRGLVNGEALPVPLTFGSGATRGTDYAMSCPTTLPTGVTCNNLNTAPTPTVTFTGAAGATTADTVTLTLSATTDNTAEPGGETVEIGLGTLNTSSGTGLDGGASGTDSLAPFSITDPDTTAPTVEISGVPTRISTTTALTATFTFSEDVTGFTTDDITVGGGTKGAFSATSAKVYTLAITPTSGSNVEVSVAADAATDGVNTGPTSAETATALWTALIFSSTTLTVVEEATATYTVALSSQPTASVTVTVAGASGEVTFDTDSDAGGNQNTLTFNASNWGTAQTVTVAAGQDNDAANDSATLTHTASGGGYGSVTGSVAVTVADNDSPGLVLDPTALTVAEGGSGTYTVALATEPTGNVTVTVGGASGEVTFDTDSGTPGTQSTLTFTATNWSTAQPVTVAAGQDNDAANDSATLTHSASGGGYGSVTGSVAVTVADNDSPGLVLDPTALTVAEGGSGTYTVALATEPTGNVTVTVGGASGEVTFDTDSGTPGTQSTLTFTATNWSTAQPVTVSAGQDNDAANDSATLTHSASGGGYGSVTGSVAVTVADNDSPGLVLDPTALTVAEGGSGTYTVALATEPTGNVTVTVGGASGEVTFDTDSGTPGTQSTLTFTATNWSTAQPVTVSAGQDNDAANDSATLTHSASGGGYGSVTGSVAITVADNDTPGVAAAQPADRQAAEGSSSDTADFTVNLDTEPSASVTVTVTAPSGLELDGPDADSVFSSSEALTFTAANWNSAQTLTARATDNSVDDPGARELTVTWASASTDSGYSGLSGAAATIAVIDDDPTAVTLSGADGDLDEGGTKTFAVTLGRGLVDGEALPVPLAFGGGATRNTDYTVACPSPLPAGVACNNLSTAATPTVTFTGPAARTVTLTLAAAADNAEEAGGETVDISLGALGTSSGIGLGGGASATDSLATFSINDSDAAPPPDTTGPTLSISGLPDKIGDRTALIVAFTFSEAVTGFSTDDITVSGGAKVALVASSESGDAYTLAVLPDGGADLTVTVAAGAATAGINTVPASAVSATAVWDAAPAVVVSGSPVSLVEGGASGSYTVALATDPGGAVTVTPSSGDAGAVTVSGALTFNADNWSRPQTVAVSAVDDDDSDDETVTIRHAVGGYPGVSGAPDVTVAVADDDSPPAALPVVSVSAGPAVAEGGEALFTITADPAPEGEITVGAEVSATGGFVAAAALGARSVTLSASQPSASLGVATVGDEIDEADGMVAVALQSGTGYALSQTDASASLAVADDDATAVSLSSSTADAAEDRSVTVTVTIGRALEAGERLEVELSLGGDAELGVDYILRAPDVIPPGVEYAMLDTAPRVIFNGSATASSLSRSVFASASAFSPAARGALPGAAASSLSAPIIIVPIADSSRERGSRSVSVSIAPSPEAAPVGGAESVNIDIAEPAVVDPSLTVSETSLSLDEGASASYTVALGAAPSGAVAVAVAVSEGAGVSVSPASLSFTADNWSMPQSVTVAALEDDGIDDESGALIHTASGGGYGGVSAEVSVSVMDNDDPSLTVSEASLSLDEGASASYTVALGAAPSGAVAVAVAVSDGAGVSVSPASLSFTADNWSIPQTVTVAALEDDGIDDESGALIHTASGGGYGGVSAEVSVMVADDDEPSVAGAAGAWMPRFGRVASEQILEGVGDRVASRRSRNGTGSEAAGGEAGGGFKIVFAGRGLDSYGAVAGGYPGGGRFAAGASGGEAASRGFAGGQRGAFAGRAGGGGRSSPSADPDGYSGGAATLAGAGGGRGSRPFPVPDAGGYPAAAAPSGARPAGGGAYEARPLGRMLRGALANSSFNAGGKTAGGADWGLWGRGSVATLEGRSADGVRVDGDVTTGQVGADWASGLWLFGISASHSRGEGDYSDDAGGGSMESSMTALTPYASMDAGRFSAWGAFSAGGGDMTLSPDGGAAVEADIDMRMGAAGLRGALMDLGDGLSLSLVSDAMAMRSTSDAAAGLPEAKARASRVRAAVEASWTRELADGGEFSARLEGGLRHDGGDAEEGLGAEVSAGVSWKMRCGLSAAVEGRRLVAHKDGDFSQAGASAHLAWEACGAGGLGPSASLRRRWGIATASGLDQLFALRRMGQFGAESGAGGLDAEFGWGVALPGGRFLGTPFLLHGTQGGGSTQALGWRMKPLGADEKAANLGMALKLTRRTGAADNDEHGILLEARLGF